MKAQAGRAVVTGGHGFIGLWVVERLLAEGFKVLVVDRAGGPDAGHDAVLADITTDAAARALVSYGPSVVVHAAAQTRPALSVADPLADAQANILGTVRMLEAAREAGVTAFLFLSSAAIYGEPATLPIPESQPPRPLSPYGLSKLAATRYVDHYRDAALLQAASLIPANAYGPRQPSGTDGSPIAAFMQAAVRDQPIEVHGDGGQTRDFVYVEDVVEAVWLAILWLTSGEGGWQRSEGAGPGPGPDRAWEFPARFNVSTGTETSISDLVSYVERASGRALRRLPGPARPGDIRRSCLDPSRARRALGWVPRVTLDEGLAHTYAWWSAGRTPGSALSQAAER